MQLPLVKTVLWQLGTQCQHRETPPRLHSTRSSDADQEPKLLDCLSVKTRGVPPRRRTLLFCKIFTVSILYRHSFVVCILAEKYLSGQSEIARPASRGFLSPRRSSKDLRGSRSEEPIEPPFSGSAALLHQAKEVVIPKEEKVRGTVRSYFGRGYMIWLPEFRISRFHGTEFGRKINPDRIRPRQERQVKTPNNRRQLESGNNLQDVALGNN